MIFYALWINRHGQRHWDGPFNSSSRAWAHLEMIIDKAGGMRVVGCEINNDTEG